MNQTPLFDDMVVVGTVPRAFPRGCDLILDGKCPLHARGPAACMFCNFGHLTECHYPQSCDEAQCSHLARYQEDY